MVTRKSVQYEYARLATLANAKHEDYRVIGPDLGKRFRVRFAGSAFHGCRRARAIYQALRKDSGEWEELWAKVPGADDVRVWLSMDQSTATKARIGLSKKVLVALRNLGFQDKIHLLQEEGVVTYSGKPIIKIFRS